MSGENLNPKPHNSHLKSHIFNVLSKSWFLKIESFNVPDSVLNIKKFVSASLNLTLCEDFNYNHK